MQTLGSTINDFGDWLSRYYLGRPLRRVEEKKVFDLQDASEAALIVTGDGLIDRIEDAIRLRRSVLVTGPRGCGKSYCSDQAIRRARDKNVIGGWRFLQGNREIPRDYLSEDMLIVNEMGQPELLKALAIRPPEKRAKDSSPAILAGSVKSYQEAVSRWKDEDWTVLFLDEINRFGDGFLDSLLSLTEEGKIVRRGDEYFVPLVVVATANPPGYDVTAKKLSPPLQARIARSYRVSQPPREQLVATVVDAQVSKLERQCADDVVLVVRPEQQYLAAAVTLCLWGDPASGERGIYFLTPQTRAELLAAMRLDNELSLAMRTMSKLVTFGPDSRAVADWIGAAAGLAVGIRPDKVAAGDPDAVLKNRRVIVLSGKHLEDTAVEVLGHKVRESFNEGTDPGSIALKEHCIRITVKRVFDAAGPLGALFFPPQCEVEALARVAVRALARDQSHRKETERYVPNDAAIRAHFQSLKQQRRSAWYDALVALPPQARQAKPKWPVASLAQWVKEAPATRNGDFADREGIWLEGLVDLVQGPDSSEWKRWLQEARAHGIAVQQAQDLV